MTIKHHFPKRQDYDWLSKTGNDMLQIARIANFDIKELVTRLARIRPKGGKLSAPTVERIMGEMCRQR